MNWLTNYELTIDKSENWRWIVTDKNTDFVYMIQKVPKLNDSERKTFLKKFDARKTINHPNVLFFHDYFLENGEIFMKQEYCKYGLLSEFINAECIEKNKLLHEEFLCRILYQIAFALKTVANFTGNLNLNTVLLNENYNVKLYNFYTFEADHKQKDIRMSHLGKLMYTLSTLNPFHKGKSEEDLSLFRYSEQYKYLLITMIRDTTDIKKHINKLLSNSTLLMNSTKWTEQRCFIENFNNIEVCQTLKTEYMSRIEKVKSREATLQLREEILIERERMVEMKEKNLQIMEKKLKDKLQQVDLYLKRCNEGAKSVTSCSSKASSNSQSSTKSNKMHYENLDASYVSCEVTQVTTSAKMEVNQIVKPQNFTRTLSNKRITFKLSPLKENTHPQKSHKKSFRRSQAKILEPPQYQNDLQLQHVENVGWSEENKRYAFDMLRLMNRSEETENTNVKHTFL